jgi:hypothetical protein
MTQNINIGHRHVLALYPFLFVAASRVATLAWEARARWGRAALAVLVFWYAASVLRVHPNYLAYFNEAAGGPSQGWRWLVDSNVDWGQDLPGLKGYMDRSGIPRVTLCYFGTADPLTTASPRTACPAISRRRRPRSCAPSIPATWSPSARPISRASTWSPRCSR